MSVALDRQAWLSERRSGIGASEVAAIGCVEGAWGSPWSVWAGKVGLTPLESEPSPAMQLGRDLEPILAVWFHRATGLYIAGEQTLIHHRREPRWFATVDGFVLDHDGEAIDDALGIIETKYTSEAPWDPLPQRYAWQVQWQLACSGLSAAWVAALHLPFGRPDFRVYEVARDDGLIAHQLAVVEDFWEHHVATGVPPFVDDSRATAEAIDAAWGQVATTKLPTLALDDHRETVERWTHWRKTRLDAERHEKHAGSQLRAVFGAEDSELSEGVLDGELAVSWRSQATSSIDAAALRRDHPDLAESYTRRGTTRVLRAHGRWDA